MIAVDWQPAPDWVLWIAQDADGAWWGYEAEPLQYDLGWYENEVGRRIKIQIGEANSQWRQTLRRVR
ncbi:MAG: hypothetical protein RQ736_05275 [Thiogranum sp.]|nr:hypothetical protein [Thiogranum sp.]